MNKIKITLLIALLCTSFINSMDFLDGKSDDERQAPFHDTQTLESQTTLDPNESEISVFDNESEKLLSDFLEEDSSLKDPNPNLNLSDISGESIPNTALFGEENSNIFDPINHILTPQNNNNNGTQENQCPHYNLSAMVLLQQHVNQCHNSTPSTTETPQPTSPTKPVTRKSPVTKGKYKCNHPECDYSTDRKWDLDNLHRLIHTEEKPYKCSLCKYASKRKGNLKRHMNSHTKKRRKLN